MPRFAELNDQGEVVQVREFAEQPEDLPRKGVRWRPYFSDPAPEGVDRDLDFVTTAIVVSETEVRETRTLVERPIEELREKFANRVMAAYRERIVDAMPNMAAVQKICAERDAEIVRIQKAESGRDAKSN